MCCITVSNAQIAFLELKKVCQNRWKLYLQIYKYNSYTADFNVIRASIFHHWVAGVAGAQLSLSGEAPTHQEGPTYDKQPLTHALPIHLFSKRVFLGLWKEAGKSRENPDRFRENGGSSTQEGPWPLGVSNQEPSYCEAAL